MIERTTRSLAVAAWCLAASIVVAAALHVFVGDPSDHRLDRGANGGLDCSSRARRHPATSVSRANEDAPQSGEVRTSSLAPESSSTSVSATPANVFVHIVGDDPELDGPARVVLNFSSAIDRSATYSDRRIECRGSPIERIMTLGLDQGEIVKFGVIECDYASDSGAHLFRGIFDVRSVATGAAANRRWDVTIRPRRKFRVVGRIVGLQRDEADRCLVGIDEILTGEFSSRRLSDEVTVKHDGSFRAEIPPIDKTVWVHVSCGDRSAATSVRISGDIDLGEIVLDERTYVFSGVVGGNRNARLGIGLVLTTAIGDSAVAATQIQRIGETSSDGRFEIESVPPGVYRLSLMDVADLFDAPDSASDSKTIERMHPSLEAESSALSMVVTIPAALTEFRPSVSVIAFRDGDFGSESETVKLGMTIDREIATTEWNEWPWVPEREYRWFVPANTPVALDLVRQGATIYRKDIRSPAVGEVLRISRADFDGIDPTPTSVVKVRLSGCEPSPTLILSAKVESVEESGPAFIDLDVAKIEPGVYGVLVPRAICGKRRMFLDIADSDTIYQHSISVWTTKARASTIIDFDAHRDVELTVDSALPGSANIFALTPDGRPLRFSFRWKDADHVMPTRAVAPFDGEIWDDDHARADLDLAPGRYVIELTPFGQPPRTLDFTIRSGETTPVIVHVED